MRLLRGYNENSFLYSWKEDVKVTLDTILQSLGACKRYTISSDVSNYLTYIDDEVFYVSPSFEQVKTDNKISTLNPHFILFSALLELLERAVSQSISLIRIMPFTGIHQN